MEAGQLDSVTQQVQDLVDGLMERLHKEHVQVREGGKKRGGGRNRGKDGTTEICFLVCLVPSVIYSVEME